MLINLVPDFLAALESSNPMSAYQRYHDTHRPVLDAYWRNYVLDPDSSQAEDVIRAALAADRSDLRNAMHGQDIVRIAEDATARAAEMLGLDRPADVYLMVGMGAANAGELVINGRGAAFICVEHFTGRPNAETYGMGLAPNQIAPWVAHEVAHLVRYLSPDSRSDLKRLIAENAGYYDFWLTGSRATLLELVVNEGLAVHAAQQVSPGFGESEYFGYARRHHARLRELESFLRRAMEPELPERGLGLRLRYLTGGMSPSARMVAGRVIPERAGYYLGWRIAEPMVSECGIQAALRASADEVQTYESLSRGIRGIA